MDAKDSPYVPCRDGVFILPPQVYRALSAQATGGFFYLREDEDVLTISTSRLADGLRRAVNARFRVPMFRNATCLAIADYSDSIRVMAVE